MLRRRAFLLLLLLYCLLDFANPLMPGAVRFLDSSVEGIQAEQWKSIRSTVSAIPADRIDLPTPPASAQRVAILPARSLPHQRPRFLTPSRRALISPAPDSSPHSSDH
ncbi:MAG TPA: hypothetical protein VGX21_01760 [Methylomirabilota bacterium]|jgi:hypothetical protein|nr:hypothetical protein [Methylomirabilota bacterium]